MRRFRLGPEVRLLLPVTAGFLIVLIGSVAAPAQTFNVTVGPKTAGHPNPGGSIQEAYYIDGVEGAELRLTRGTTYTFAMQGVLALHPFYLSTSASGGGAGAYGDGVSGNFASGTQTVTVTPGPTTPDLLYYQCGSHTNMGWRIHVADALPRLTLEEVASGFTSPVGMAVVPGGAGRFAVVDQVGVVHLVTPSGDVLATPFLDVRDRIVSLRSGYDERGLLGLAFHPGYAENGRLYVYYSAPARDGAPEGYDHTARVSEFTVSGNPDVADPGTERVLLDVDQPQSNHNGGTLAFGPVDGYLYVSLGDGGGANDVGLGHVDDWYTMNEGGNGQDVTTSLLGSVLRIDVDGGDGSHPYGVPEDNPFVGRDGFDEIYAYGFRNPWRFSFDPGGDHDLLVGDAGQNLWEEVSLVTRGGNYGWNVREGTHCFSTADPGTPPASCPAAVGEGHSDVGAPLLPPVIEYAHPPGPGGFGLVVVAGQVYRGSQIPDLDGRYVFADWSDSFGAPSGQLLVATPQEEGLWPVAPLALEAAATGTIASYVLALGQDADGEVYVLTTHNAGPSGTTGRVLRLATAGGTAAGPDDPGTAQPRLDPPFPNPSRGTTTLRYALGAGAGVVLEVSDALGRRVRLLAAERVAAGEHEVVFDGRGLARGVYVVRLSVDGAGVDQRRLALVR